MCNCLKKKRRQQQKTPFRTLATNLRQQLARIVPVTPKRKGRV